ncbi:SDR family oxidoreductase [Sphingobium sp. HBC34]|uniref:SDR family oxidoreductase n=1 Tax=Sphingobium cyanobacteriorum TaxID=3063954 RepID=A0ABT8ZLV7_9SPHN|nr:SDR family oxidoreductase [Sphingobium sp. HBC34]MDO7835530.1 SDR family oxidoreductase [Sphingobium sp. HBC34]
MSAGQKPVAVITGGSGGLAPGIAQSLLDQGYHVVLVARDTDRLRHAADALMRGSAMVDRIGCDVRQSSSVKAMTLAVLDRLGRIDLLVNAAASSNPIGGAIETVDVGLVIGDLDTKVGGYLRCIQAVAPVMKRQGAGRIINIGGLTGRSSDTLSGLRNAAVTHLTKVLSDQLGPFGITVNAVHPGITRTPHLDELFADMAAEKGVASADIEHDFISEIPTRRLCLPEEIGHAIAFLAGPQGGSINGQSITVDGGYSRGVYL